MRRTAVIAAAALALIAASALIQGTAAAEQVDGAFIQANAENVKDLGLVWSYGLHSTRGVEATPLVADGVMYVTAPWSVMHAVDARTGKTL